jgi:hypothetical protein
MLQAGRHTYHELDIVREDDLCAINNGLRRSIMGHVDHPPWVAGVEDWAGLVPGSLILVLDTERLDLEPNDAGQVCLGILVVKDGEAEVVVQEVLDIGHLLCWDLWGSEKGPDRKVCFGLT